MENGMMERVVNPNTAPDVLGRRAAKFRRNFKIPALDVMLGVAIAQEREKQGLIRAELAEIVGISNQMISKYENGEPTFSVAAVYAICAGLDIDPREHVFPDPETLGVAETMQRPSRRGKPTAKTLRTWMDLIIRVPPIRRALIIKVVTDLVEGFEERAAELAAAN